MLVKYVRLPDRTPIGVVCAIGRDIVGWSQCNFKKGDRFSKKLGIKIAVGRAKTGWTNLPAYVNGQDLIGKELSEMRERSRRYYKDAI